MYGAIAAGLWEQVPVHEISSTQPDQPIFMSNIRYEASAGMIFWAFFPELGAFGEQDALYKWITGHVQHPTKQIIQECEEDWAKYQNLFTQQGKKHDWIPYPYNIEMIAGWCAEYSAAVPWPGGITVDGPNMAEATKQLEEGWERTYNYFDQKQMPQVIVDSKLHKGSGRQENPMDYYSAKMHMGERSKLTASHPMSTMDFDAVSYEEWSEWTSKKFRLEDIEGGTSYNIMENMRTWDLIMERLSAVRGVFPNSQRRLPDFKYGDYFSKAEREAIEQARREELAAEAEAAAKAEEEAMIEAAKAAAAADSASKEEEPAAEA